MQTKVCNKCGVKKGIGDFHKSKGYKDGVKSKCKDCVKQYNQENRERKIEYDKQYYQENRDRKLEYRKRYRQENREKALERVRQYKRENRERISERNKQYRQENRERLIEYQKQYYQENRERLLERRKQYYQENRDYYIAHAAKREARKINATPEWLTPIDFLVMRHIYETCPEGHHVDHIVPLRGKTACGLHVPWNLQHLTAAENISKGNREWPDMWLLEEEVA